MRFTEAPYREVFHEDRGGQPDQHQYMFSLSCPKVEGKGPKCEGTKEITVNGPDLFDYQSRGKKIQEAFPYLTVEDRERMLSGYCSPCWDRIFSDQEGS